MQTILFFLTPRSFSYKMLQATTIKETTASKNMTILDVIKEVASEEGEVVVLVRDEVTAGVETWLDEGLVVDVDEVDCLGVLPIAGVLLKAAVKLPPGGAVAGLVELLPVAGGVETVALDPVVGVTLLALAMEAAAPFRLPMPHGIAAPPG